MTNDISKDVRLVLGTFSRLLGQLQSLRNERVKLQDENEALRVEIASTKRQVAETLASMDHREVSPIARQRIAVLFGLVATPAGLEPATCARCEGTRAALAELERWRDTYPEPGSAMALDPTYYDKGKDAPYFENLSDKNFVWELEKIAQDLNDSTVGDYLEKWMPISAIISSAADRIKRK